MTRVKPGQRKRAFKPKARTGCLTCKIRRLKCDEGKPHCYKCISSGRECEGYAPDLRQQYLRVSGIRLDSLISNPSTPVGDGPRDTRSYQFFFERTLIDFTKTFANPLWTAIIPVLTRYEPSICHAVLSLSKFHEQYLEQRQIGQAHIAPTKDGEGLSQYNYAIAKLLGARSTSPPPADIYLISCVLFISIEFLRGNYSAAISLGIHGLKMIRDLQHPTRSKLYTTRCTPTERAKLLPLIDLFFLRVECQVFVASWMTPIVTCILPKAQDSPFNRSTDVAGGSNEDVGD